MNIDHFDCAKTGLLFFDMLNVYYRGASLETQERMKPVVDNAVRLMDGARKVSMPIYYAMANHRPDGQSRSMIVTDTDMRVVLACTLLAGYSLATAQELVVGRPDRLGSRWAVVAMISGRPSRSRSATACSSVGTSVNAGLSITPCPSSVRFGPNL